MKTLFLYINRFKFFPFVLLLIALACFSCNNDTHDRCSDGQTGVFKNLTGLDGCGWIIQLDNSTKLEPINLDDFNIELQENKKVCVKYHVRNDLGSFCMVGTVVEIHFIE